MRASNRVLLGIAAVCMADALAFQNVTLASGDYRCVLAISIVAMIAADACCLIVSVRGGPMRWAAISIAAPSLFILVDTLRRAPYVWGR